MSQQSSWKKILVTTMICTLISGAGAAYAETTGTTAANAAASVQAAAAPADRPSTPFSDVKKGHWAEKHIAKLALQGIVRGNGGKFKPAESITRQDAVIMAIRFMGLDQEMDENGAIIFPDVFEVGNYAKAYVALALQKKLLDQTEEYALAEAEPDAPWGTARASREWVTKLIVRAIGQTAMADKWSDEPSAFGDRAQIGESYEGYVSTAVSLGLIKGVSPDKFNPKGLIDRASLATLLSRAESQISVGYKGQTAGVVASLTDSSLTVVGKDGKSTTYSVAADTLLYRFDSDQPASLATILPYTDAIVISANGKALYIEQSGADQKIETISGTVASIVPAERKIWLRVGAEFVSINYDDTLRVQDGGGQLLAAADLKEGSTVELDRDTFRSAPLAVNVRVKGAPVNKTGQGTVVSVMAGSITIADNATGTSSPWSIASTVAVTKQGRPAALGDLAAGDTIAYEIVNDLVTKVTVSQAAAQTVSGRFEAVSADGKLITYTVGGRAEADFLASSVEVTINGIPNAALADLTAQDTIDLTLNGQGKVSAVKVTNRNVQTVNGASITSYAAAAKILTLTDASGNPLALKLTDKTRIDFNGTLFTLEAASQLLLNNRKISVSYFGSTAVSLSFVYKYSGTLISLNTTAKQVTLQLADGSTIVLPAPTPAVELYGKSAATAADVQAGQTVTLLLDTNQEKVLSIQVHKTVQMTVASVDTAGKKINLTTSEGVTSPWSVGTGVAFIGEKGEALTFPQLTAGQTVNVTLIGRQLAEVKRVLVTIGIVVSFGTDTITFADYSGKTTEVALGAGYRIVKNDAVAATTSTLAAGDRIEIRKDEQDKTLVSVIAGISKKFWKYEAATNELHVIRANLSDNYRYKLAPDTVFTSDDAGLSILDLRQGDPIVLYRYQGKLLEVVKL
ncbi:hypothetical protein BG53_07510 [Paenibacillus darwinianus]|uniref:SLH domain-containing protein n=1 Tax=Paenibacillus darwinianus TaxID=1380763 RepID=A0A9W5W877_9BACL|nr:S-layer homology domain-containing protein [Paenibacillus darwinianus]EXX85109.1 hypothetical protein BG52_09105 [Paenibacillus darwinianus]EXX91887.1 hypothetical protein BG53_07510 [Paenibacillus darwinianus]EXX92653.1 hypothetical protein CH50_06470 [Paenibacillus darwinianus]